MPRASFFFVVVVVFFSSGGHTSRIYHQGVALEQVVQRADVVVVAVPADPPTRSAPVDITPSGQKKNAATWPPYTRTWSRWVVQEILFDAQKETPKKALRVGLRGAVGLQAGLQAGLQVGAVVEVDDADHTAQLELHKKYYVEKISKSPIYERYVVNGESAQPARLLLLARESPAGLRFVVDGAAELLEHRDAIAALLRSK